MDNVLNTGSDSMEDDNAKIFPQKLMEILNEVSNQNSIAWLPHGKAFLIINRQKFANEVLPKYFRKTKYTSFTRKLNRWNFTRVIRGPEMGSYHHEFFQRGNEALCTQMYCKNDRAKYAVTKQDKPKNGGDTKTATKKPTTNHRSTNELSASQVEGASIPQLSVQKQDSNYQTLHQQRMKHQHQLDLLVAMQQAVKPPVPAMSPAAQTRAILLQQSPEQQSSAIFQQQQQAAVQRMLQQQQQQQRAMVPNQAFLQMQMAAVLQQQQRMQRQPNQRAQPQTRSLNNYRASAA